MNIDKGKLKEEKLDQEVEVNFRIVNRMHTRARKKS